MNESCKIKPLAWYHREENLDPLFHILNEQVDAQNLDFGTSSRHSSAALLYEIFQSCMLSVRINLCASPPRNFSFHTGHLVALEVSN